MTYPQAQDYLNSFINYECLNLYPYKSSFRLERVRKLLQSLGNPHKTLRVIHIAGTKGKGSTCVFVANILRATGFKVGLYTSPHLIDIRERIKILQPLVASRLSLKKDKISKRSFVRIIEKIRPQAERLRETNLGKLSYFEVLTTLAFLYFKEKKVDFAVLETGIGGRLDATNAVSSLVCAITPISYEHTQILGTTLKEITTEKVEIIKPKAKDAKGSGQIVVIAPQRPVVLEIIRRRVKKLKAKLYEVGKDIQIKERSVTVDGQVFDAKGVFGRYSRLKIGLLGRHQIINAAVAIGCAESLRNFGVKVLPEAIREGLRRTFWPGRLQIISRKPLVVLDGAQNRASSFALKDALFNFFKFRNLILVLGVSQDKDVRGILRELVPSANRIILTKTQNPRALKPEIIKSFIDTNRRPIVLTDDSIQALRLARKSARQKDLILICGSLFLVGEVLKNEKEWKIYF